MTDLINNLLTALHCALDDGDTDAATAAFFGFTHLVTAHMNDEQEGTFFELYLTYKSMAREFGLPS